VAEPPVSRVAIPSAPIERNDSELTFTVVEHARGRPIMMLAGQVARLSRLQHTTGPVVSAYLNTQWTDEHQRERTRLFLKGELRRIRAGGLVNSMAAALDWVEAEADAIISQASHTGAHGVALFACPALGLREVISVRGSLENTLVVADRPFLRPLAAVLGESPPALVVFIDAESARLVPLLDAGLGEEVRLDSEVPGHHRRGGWAQLALGHYQRHIEERRGQHLEAVSDALGRLIEEHGLQRIVIAGGPDNASAFRRALPAAVAARVAGIVAGRRHEPASELAARAGELISRVAAAETQAAVDAILTETAKGGHAAASPEGVLEAVRRGAVDRLYLLRDFQGRGRACTACGALQPGDMATCRLCRQPTLPVELGEAMVTRTIAAGGAVTTVDAHAALGAVGGVAARLRFAL
jgi:peptide chain release factor subunit 1